MKKWAIVFVMGIIWCVGLTFGSGWGIAYDIYGKTKLVTICVFLYLFVFRGKFHKIHKNLLVTLLVLGVDMLVAYIRYEQTVGDYLWVWLLVPMLAECRITPKQMQQISLMYGVLGGAVLFVANYGSLFRGWNPNSIAMIAFFSYMVFITSFSEVRNRWGIFVLVVYSVVYFAWMEILDARSSILFSIAAFLCVFSIIPLRSMRRLPLLLNVILIAPLVLAIIIVVMKNAEVVDSLNTWSMGRYGKMIFNGRERIWSWGLRDYWQAPVFGHGTFAGNFHNSAVTMLYGAGAVGYGIWVLGTRALIRPGLKYIRDSIIYGLMIAFLMIWLQQSLELGLIASRANLVPYAVLGLLVGRIRQLERENVETIHNYPSL